MGAIQAAVHEALEDVYRFQVAPPPHVSEIRSCGGGSNKAPKMVVNPTVREPFEVIPHFDFPINETNIAFNSYRYSNRN